MGGSLSLSLNDAAKWIARNFARMKFLSLLIEAKGRESFIFDGIDFE